MSPGKYYFWVGVFLTFSIALIFVLYAATMRIDYVWAWHKLPSAFLYHNTVEVQSEIEGEVQRISR